MSIKIDWNEHNLLNRDTPAAVTAPPVTETMAPVVEPTPIEVATAEPQEVPIEEEVVQLTPQTGDGDTGEISSEGDLIENA